MTPTNTAFAIVEEQDIEREAMAIPEKAKCLVVTDDNTMTMANNTKLEIREMVKEVDGFFKPLADRAFQNHRAITGRWNEVKAPLKEADDYLTGQVKGYLRKLEEARQAEERRLAEIARREAEERKLAEALEAEACGAQAEAEAILDEPVFVPTPIVPRTGPKVDQRMYRTTWKARVTDPMKLIRFVAAHPQYVNLLMPNESSLNTLARSLKQNMRIEGVEVFEI